MGWVRKGKNEWSQYVGRRVRRLRVGSGDIYISWAGRTFCGRWGTLTEAQAAAEKKNG